MDRNGAFALTIAASALVAAQAPINSHLGKAIGTFQAAFISFAIGTLALVVVVSFAGGFGQIHLTSVPWYYLTGGRLVTLSASGYNDHMMSTCTSSLFTSPLPQAGVAARVGLS